MAQTLISNPKQYAELLTFSPNPEPKFKSSQNLLDLIPLLSNLHTTQSLSSPNVSSLLSMLQSLKDFHFLLPPLQCQGNEVSVVYIPMNCVSREVFEQDVTLRDSSKKHASSRNLQPMGLLLQQFHKMPLPLSHTRQILWPFHACGQRAVNGSARHMLPHLSNVP